MGEEREREEARGGEGGGGGGITSNRNTLSELLRIMVGHKNCSI
jgi:hypothetical protein